MYKNKKTLYMHIGFHKTGTSLIQRFCSENRSYLSEYNLHLIETGLHKELNAHYELAASIDPHHCLPQDRGRIWDEVAKEINNNNNNRFLISCERFCRGNLRNPDLLAIIRKILSPYNIKIIIYLRAQDELIQSVYQQVVKEYSQRLKLTIREMIQENWLNVFNYMNYEKALLPWEEVFGADNIIIKIYEKSKLKNGLVRDFLSIFGIKPPDDFDEKSIILDTRGFNKNVIDFLRKSNNFSLNQAVHQKLIRDLSFISQTLGDKSVLDNHELLSDKDKIMIRDYFSDSNKKVAYKYLRRDDGILFDDVKENAVNMGENKQTEDELAKLNAELEIIILLWQNIMTNKENINTAPIASNNTQQNKSF